MGCFIKTLYLPGTSLRSLVAQYMKTTVQAFLVFFMLVFASSVAFACTCSNPSQRQRFRSADVVFVGEVLEFREISETEHAKSLESDPENRLGGMPYRVTFNVEKQWKGKRQPRITASAGDDAVGWCDDLDLSVGKRILVYAPREFGQLLIARECGPNRYGDAAEDEIKRLNNFFFRAYTFLYPYPKS
ncbi:MAG: hypothetical protein R2684_08560 [Pyrinomonadaceae bacterium]